MIFFEINFRILVSEEDILSLIKDFYPKIPLIFHPHAQFYNEEMKCPKEYCCFVYELLYSSAGFRTFLKGEIYNEGSISEIALAIYFANRVESEIVIGDFTGRSSFLLIKPDGSIYRIAPIGIGDAQYHSEIFEIDYNTLSPAVDLGEIFR